MKKTIRGAALLLTLMAFALLVSCTKTEETAVTLWDNAIYTEDATLGKGSKEVKLIVSAEDKSITLTINTDADILGDALKENALVEGEESSYGLYIKKVNGILADYDIDGYYWAFEKNGEYMMTGVDSTEISDGEQYELVRKK